MERIDIGVIGAHNDTRTIGVCMRETKLLACVTAPNAVGHHLARTIPWRLASGIEDMLAKLMPVAGKVRQGGLKRPLKAFR